VSNKPLRTMLYIPGNNPAMLQNAMVFGADSVLFDLEDAVAINEKDSARNLVRNMLALDGIDLDVISVRINDLGTPFGRRDLEEIIPLKPGTIRVPKVDSPKDVTEVIEILDQLDGGEDVEIHPLIESPLGVENAFRIATCSDRVAALTIGGQDLTANMGIKKTDSGRELLYTRQRVVMAAKAAGIKALDTVYIDVNNDDGLIDETSLIRDLGFDGKAVIHPRQIAVVHEVYRPAVEEVDFARRVISQMEVNKKKGVGVFAIDGKMVDAPVVKRAETMIELAALYGM
jgi:citrate lyase subunit beta/citryl-CoA lyase